VSIVISLGDHGEVSEFAVANDSVSSEESETERPYSGIGNLRNFGVCVRVFCCEGNLRQQDQTRDLRENLRYVYDEIVGTHLKGKPQRIL
jgi:hypothetical protein